MLPKNNTYIFISANGNYYIIQAMDEANAISELNRRNKSILNNLKNTLEINGTPRINETHE